MFHKDYDRNGSVEKNISGRGFQDKLIGGKPPVVK
jgi:hypothetical protein